MIEGGLQGLAVVDMTNSTVSHSSYKLFVSIFGADWNGYWTKVWILLYTKY